jgi:hypothetical protein
MKDRDLYREELQKFLWVRKGSDYIASEFALETMILKIIKKFDVNTV